jgi:hypothetical protein
MLSTMLLLGLTWDASFEATPANTDLVSQGDDRIRELKVETADRAEKETCWGATGTGGCANDTGWHREGSARGFLETTAPTALKDLALTPLGANDDGRLWIDSDGADNIGGNNDDGQLWAWNGGAAAGEQLVGKLSPESY